MTFIDILEEAGNTPEASYIKFLHHYKFHDKTLHFFFEGLDDQSFYANFIENTFSQEYTFHYYVCNGKANVYINYNDINWSIYNKNRVLFFTDKDIDDIIGITNNKDVNIFETQYYSIENYLVNSEVYSRFLRDICYITNDNVISQLNKKFTIQLEKFHELMIQICAWVVYCRTNRLEVNLSDIDVSNIFEITSDFRIKRKVKSGYRTPFEYICASTKTNYYNFSEIKNIATALKKISPVKKFLRGKYELWFLYAFCKKTIDVTIPELNKVIKQHNQVNITKLTKCKITIPIKAENILQITATRVRPPSDVSAFLISNYKEISVS